MTVLALPAMISCMLSGCQKRIYEPAAVSFSVLPGACPEGAVLRLTAPEEYIIRYTTDGTLPGENSPKYFEGITLSGSGTSWLNEETADLIRIENTYELNECVGLADAWIIRAAAFAPDGTMGPVSTRTYFPGRSIVSDYDGIMVVSLVTEPGNLLDYDRGIMVKGRVYDEWIAEDGHQSYLTDHSAWYCEQYLEDHFGLKDVLIMKEGEYEDGNEDACYLFEELNEFAGRDFSDESIYEQFCAAVDVQSMADYFAAMIYMANYDFAPDKNFELWRSVGTGADNSYADGRWRFMMYDTEFSSGLYNDDRTSYDRDSLEDVTEHFPLFAAALNAPEFRNMFLTSLKQIGTYDLSSQRVNETLEQWDREWSHLMKDQYLRFGDIFFRLGP